MKQPASPRRTFLGHILSGTAALWVSATGLLSSVLAACEPTVKYGGPPPESQPPFPLGGSEEGPTTSDGRFASPPPDGGLEPLASASAEPPLPVPKYGGPPPGLGPITVKYGGPRPVPKYGGPSPLPPPTVTAPPVKPKYGGPPMTTKYGGPRKYGGPPPGLEF